MEKHEYQTLSLAEILEILKRRKWILLLSMMLALVPSALYNHWATPIYQAEAIVAFEDHSREAVPGLELVNSLSSGNFAANCLQEMKTRIFARQVYGELPDSARQQFRLPEPLPPPADTAACTVEMIRENLSVALISATDLVTISYVAENPELAKTVTNAVVAVLQKSNLRIRRQEYTNVREFIDEQIDVVKDRLQQAESALRDFKSNEHITSLEDESKEVLERITQAEVLYNQIRSDKDARQKRLGATQKKLDEQKSDLASSVTQITSPLTARLKEKLVELQVRYSGLQVQNYPENHPKLVELKTEIDQTKQNLVQATKQILEGEKLKGVIDPLSQLQKSLEESIVLEVELQGLSAQEANLQKILNNYAGYLKKLPDKELKLVRLMRDKEVNNKIYTQLLNEREQARIREAAEIGNIRLVEPAETPLLPARPRKGLNLLIGALTGAVLGLLLIFFSERVQETPRTEEEIERLLGLPVLALVPEVKRGLALETTGGRRKRILINHDAATPLIQDAYSYLWSSLQLSNRRRPLIVMVASAGPAEGKSTLASNLCLTAVRHGKKTILVDGDLRKPVLHEIFGVSCSPGLRNLVVEAHQTWPSLALPDGTASRMPAVLQRGPDETFRNFHEAIFPALDDTLQMTGTENLRLLTMGDPLLDPDMLWNSVVTEEILSMLRRIADFVVIDTPPVIGIPDACTIARYCDGVILCVAAGQTEKSILLRFRKILEQANSKLWGVVLNKVEANMIYGPSKYYKDYGKYYHKSKH